MLGVASSKQLFLPFAGRLSGSLSGVRSTAMLLAALAAPLYCIAAPGDDAAGANPAPLNLKLPRSPARAFATTKPSDAPAASEHQRRGLRLEPRKSIVERGVEGSRDALIACQNGAYPGATVSAHGVQVNGGDSQPGHCYRF